MSTAEMTPTRSDAASSAHLRTPGSAGPISSPDPSQLVERLQALKSRLSNMTKTLEQSVAAASPLRGKSNEEILYSTPKLVTQLLEGPLGQDAALFLEPGQAAAPGTQVTEVRFTLAGASEEEIEALIELLKLQDAQGLQSSPSRPLCHAVLFFKTSQDETDDVSSVWASWQCRPFWNRIHLRKAS